MTHRPPGTFLPPTSETLAADQQRRLHSLEQRPQARLGGESFEVTVTNPAPITLADPRQTGRWWPWRGAMRLHYIIATADGVTSPLSVGVRRSGVEVVSLGWDADGVLREGHDVTWSPGQSLDLTAEGDVSLLVVQLQFTGTGNGALQFVIPATGGGG